MPPVKDFVVPLNLLETNAENSSEIPRPKPGGHWSITLPLEKCPWPSVMMPLPLRTIVGLPPPRPPPLLTDGDTGLEGGRRAPSSRPRRPAAPPCGVIVTAPQQTVYRLQFTGNEAMSSESKFVQKTLRLSL